MATEQPPTAGTPLPVLHRVTALRISCLADSGYEGAGIETLVSMKNPAGTTKSTTAPAHRTGLLPGPRSLRECGLAPPVPIRPSPKR